MGKGDIEHYYDRIIVKPQMNGGLISNPCLSEFAVGHIVLQYFIIACFAFDARKNKWIAL